MPAVGRLAAAVAVVLVTGACGASSSRSDARGEPDDRIPTLQPSTSTEPSQKRSAEPPEVEAYRVVAAGDISCLGGTPVNTAECQMDATAQLVESLDPDVVLPLGDLQYQLGKRADFDAAYATNWGRFKAITRPVVGNHEYTGGKANGYFGYFGDAAHGPDGWYSFDAGATGWHVVVLNSVCGAVGGCGEGSRQLAWLRADLAATTSECLVAAWHHPRWSSGLHGSDESMDPIWRTLAARGADLVLSGHDHHYERFEPKDGLVQLVAGTGGRSLYPVLAREAGSIVVQTSGFGVLDLELRPGEYKATFRPVPGFDFSDSSTRSC
jgi:hypothetical protein